MSSKPTQSQVAGFAGPLVAATGSAAGRGGAGPRRDPHRLGSAPARAAARQRPAGEGSEKQFLKSFWPSCYVSPPPLHPETKGAFERLSQVSKPRGCSPALPPVVGPRLEGQLRGRPLRSSCHFRSVIGCSPLPAPFVNAPKPGG